MLSRLKNLYATGRRNAASFIFASLPALLFFAVSIDSWSADAGVKNLRLACLSERLIRDVRDSPKSGIRKSWTLCEREFSNNIASLALTEKQKRVAFVSVLAYSMAPYGPSVSTSLGDLLKEKVLDCDNYAILFGHFSSLFVGSDVQIQFAGFDGGKIGNHAQTFVIVDGAELLLDPTIGLIARATFDDIVSGKPIPNHLVKRFRQHNDKSIDDFSDRVVGAIIFGGYRPRNILYYFASLSDYLAFTDEIAPLWVGDLTRLIRRFPTPASTSLRINLEHSGKGK